VAPASVWYPVSKKTYQRKTLLLPETKKSGMAEDETERHLVHLRSSAHRIGRKRKMDGRGIAQDIGQPAGGG